MNGLLRRALPVLALALVIARAAVAGPASEGDLLPMRGIDGRYGYIDRTGAWKITPRWVEAERFRHGLASVTDALGRKTYIRPDGTLLTGGTVLYPDPERNWIPVQKGEEHEVIDRTGKVILPARKSAWGKLCDGVILSGSNWSRWSVLDLKGNQLTQLPRELYEVRCFREGLAAAWMVDRNRPKDAPPEGWGFIDQTGAWVIPPHFMTVRDFKDGVAFAERNWEWRLIDKKGRDVTSDRWLAAGNFSEGLAAVLVGAKVNESRQMVGGTFGYIDRTGRMMIPPRYERALAFKDGVALVKAVGGGYGVIDTRGQLLAPTTFADAWDPNEGVFCATKGKGAVGCVDLKGLERIPFVYEGFGGYEGGLAAMLKGKTWSVLDLDGKTLASGPYEQGVYLLGGAFRVDQDGRQVWMDRKGKVIASSDWRAAQRDWAEAEKAFASQDNQRGIDLLKKLAAQGHPDAMSGLADVYSLGLDGAPDPVKSKQYHERALAAGSARAMLVALSARLPQDGKSTAAKEDLAMLERAATGGDAGALAMWGLALLEGRYGVPRDGKLAVKALEKSAEKGFPEGKRLYAVALYRGVGGRKAEMAKVFDLMKQAAEAGVVQAAFELGQLYERGMGTQKDPAQALRWYDEAAAKGLEEARTAAATLRAATSAPASPAPPATQPAPAPR